METKQVQNIIRSFFGKRFSKETQLRFRYWLRLTEDRDEKDATIRELWEKCPSSITERTWEDLSEMQERIGRKHTIPVRRSLFSRWGKYVAAVVLIVSTSVVTQLVNQPTVEVVSPKLVEFYVPYGDCREITLADGSIVWVNAGSLLIYPSEFTADTRTIYLSGEARFQVAKNPDKPFIVGTNHLDIQALGTVFSVCAYPNSQTTSTTLEEGSILVGVKPEKQQSSILKSGEQLVYHHQTHQIRINSVEAKQMSAWKDGYLIVENASFEQLIAALERKYDVTINYNAGKYNGRSYYVKFNPDESVEDALLILSRLIDGFKYTVTGQTISIN